MQLATILSADLTGTAPSIRNGVGRSPTYRNNIVMPYDVLGWSLQKNTLYDNGFTTETYDDFDKSLQPLRNLHNFLFLIQHVLRIIYEINHKPKTCIIDCYAKCLLVKFIWNFLGFVYVY